MVSGRNWTDVDVVREQIERAGEYAASRALANLKLLAQMNGRTDYESPLEAIFYVWWIALCLSDSSTARLIDISPQQECEANGQHYRLDFVLTCVDCDFQESLDAAGLKWPLIAVEVDGHAFHEKTKEQAALRNRRDRDLQQAGWRVFHYSWSEVITDPVNCAAEVFIAGRQAHSALLAELYRKGAR